MRELYAKLAMIAQDCEDCAAQAERLAGASAATGEARAWRSVARRIRAVIRMDIPVKE